MENVLDVIDKVNNFYVQSFNQLITLTVAIFAFIGVLLPILITLYQARQLKNDKKELENYVQEKHVQVKDEISKEIRSFFESERGKLRDELASLKDEIKKSAANAKAGLLHLQGNTSLSQDRFLSALGDFLLAASSYISAGDELNLQRVLRLALEKCLPKIDCRILESRYEIKDTFEDTITKLNKINENGRYSDVIKKLEVAYEKACARKTSVKAT